MTICKECGAVESKKHVITDYEEFDKCTCCNSEDCFKEVDESDYYRELEAEAEYQAWKDKK